MCSGGHNIKHYYACVKLISMSRKWCLTKWAITTKYREISWEIIRWNYVSVSDVWIKILSRLMPINPCIWSDIVKEIHQFLLSPTLFIHTAKIIFFITLKKRVQQLLPYMLNLTINLVFIYKSWKWWIWSSLIHWKGWWQQKR